MLILLATTVGCDEQPTSAKAALPRSLNGSGIIRGQVSFVGEAPPPRPITPNDSHCAGEEPLVDESLVVNSNHTLKNVIVYVEDAPATDGSDVPQALLDQVQCRYRPHVLGVQVGQSLEIRSSDATMHNVHFVPQRNRARNFAMTQVGDHVQVSFDYPEFIRMRCDVHPWMSAWVGVFSNPLFAVTGDDGAFEIKGVPSGAYKLVAWHEVLGSKTIRLTVADGGPSEASFSFSNEG